MREDVEFDAEGVTLRGWLYRPDGAAGPVPTVVMAHGFSAVKEMYLDSFAEAFAAGGLGALVFDNRNFGASDGEPRQEIDPWAQVRDYRHAITWAQTRPEVDPDRIGVWGSSYSGGHVLVLGAIDKRIKCVACQVPLVSGFRNIQRLVRQDFLAHNRAAMDQDRAARYRGELLMEYEPSAYLERISPTPLLMVVAAGDHLTPTDLALEAYQRAREPKELVLLPGGHFDAYTKDFDAASGAARDWFLKHLGRSG